MWYDALASLTNMRARWYDTQSGVFTSVDPAIASTNQPYQFANGDPVNNSDPSGLNTLSGPAVWDGCTSSNWGSCQAAWNQSKSDILALQNQQFPGFNWGAEFSSTAEAAVAGAIISAGTGCVADAATACLPGAIVGGIVGFVSGVIGGIVGGIADQNSYINGQYVYNFLDSTLNIIFSDTYNYIGSWRNACNNSVNCVNADVLQYTSEFLLASGAMVGVAGSAAVSQALAEISNLYGEASGINGVGKAAGAKTYQGGNC